MVRGRRGRRDREMTDIELQEQILAQVRHLRWAASQGYTVPVMDEEPIPRKIIVLLRTKEERDPLEMLHQSYFYETQRKDTEEHVTPSRVYNYKCVPCQKCGECRTYYVYDELLRS